MGALAAAGWAGWEVGVAGWAVKLCSSKIF